MDQIFRACREIGRAEWLRRRGVDGTRYLSQAAAALRLVRDPPLGAQASALQNISARWVQASAQLPGVFFQIQTVAGKDTKPYHAASAGFWFGLALEACQHAGADTNLSEIAEALEMASNHTLALQRSVPGMPGFGPSFNALIAGVRATSGDRFRVDQEMRRTAQLVRGLSDQVGNAI